MGDDRMDDSNQSLWDWLVLEIKHPRVRRAAILALAVLFIGGGIVTLWIAGFENGNGGVLILLGALAAWIGIAFRIPDESQADAEDWLGLFSKPQEALASIDPAAGAEGASRPQTRAGLTLVRFPIAVCFALVAQAIKDLHPYGMDASQLVGWFFYGVAAIAAIWALVAGDLAFPITPGGQNLIVGRLPEFRFPQWVCLLSATAFAVLAFFTFTIYFEPMPCLFLLFAVLYWILAVSTIIKNEQIDVAVSLRAFLDRLREKMLTAASGWHLSPWTMLCLAVFIGLALLRTYRLELIPPEMTSDHAEKLLDVNGILRGQTYIYFANNGGREPLEFYLVALVEAIFGTGVTFLSLKIVSVAEGILALPFMYLLAKEWMGKRAGLLAMVLVGVGYWPDVISRIGLRFPLSPLFSAMTLYFFWRALRRKEWNSFIWAGLALGIGLNGYTTMRILPFALVLTTILFAFSSDARGSRWWAAAGLGVALGTAFLLFLPMLRYASLYPDAFMLRTITRIAPIGGSVTDPIGVFFANMSQALRMFSENDGVGWFQLVPLRPALDIVTGAFFHLGVLLAIGFAFQRRSWESLLLPLAVPILLLPSVMALALPSENPSLTRGSAAIPVVFLLAVFGLAVFFNLLRRWFSPQTGWLAGVMIAALLGIGGIQNLDLTLSQYPEVYGQNCENASELGDVIQSFAKLENSFDEAHVIPYPLWVDGRLVSIYAGAPDHDFEILPKDLPGFPTNGKWTMFLLHAQDTDSLKALQTKYPQGSWKLIPSKYPGDDFIEFVVSPDSQALV
jgi:hypothetical protein